MLPLESVLSGKYNAFLLESFGNPDLTSWMPMISKIVETLDIDLQEPFRGTKITNGPVVSLLIGSWMSVRGLPDDLFDLKESLQSTPYQESTVYKIIIKTPEEFLSGISGREVYRDYQRYYEIFEGKDYQTLRKLHGLTVEIV